MLHTAWLGQNRLQALLRLLRLLHAVCLTGIDGSWSCEVVRLVESHLLSIALQGRDRAKEPAASWWHTDQAPRRTGLHCIQGLLNITDVGPHAGDSERDDQL